MDTIFALATAPGKAGIAVIRVSGPKAADAVVALCGSIPEPRRATVAGISSADGSFLDEAMVLWFPQPASFTGESVVEFHVHGSLAVVRSVLRELGEIEGLRSAEAGEFTRRALENGKLDLSRVEGLGDLLSAETEAQRRLAMRLFRGELGEIVDRWRTKLVGAAALLAAMIDFADEEIPDDLTRDAGALISEVIEELRRKISSVDASERVRQGFEVAIVGAPNVGKSTLLNRIAGREVALTSVHAGTTRDVLEVNLDLGGIAVTLLDTAGVREDGDEVETLGIERGLARAAQADIRVFLQEGEEAPPLELEKDDISLKSKKNIGLNGVSGLTGFGVDELLSGLQNRLEKRVAAAGVVAHQRHREAMERAVGFLEMARSEVEAGVERVDLAAEELRGGISALEMLLGRVDVENMLDSIFSKFCVGK